MIPSLPLRLLMVPIVKFLLPDFCEPDLSGALINYGEDMCSVSSDGLYIPSTVSALFVVVVCPPPAARREHGGFVSLPVTCCSYP